MESGIAATTTSDAAAEEEVVAGAPATTAAAVGEAEEEGDGTPSAESEEPETLSRLVDWENGMRGDASTSSGPKTSVSPSLTESEASVACASAASAKPATSSLSAMP